MKNQISKPLTPDIMITDIRIKNACRTFARTFGIFTPEQQRELSLIPNLAALPSDALIALTHRQMSLMSTLPVGTVGFALEKDGVKPAVNGSSVYHAADIRRFCAIHSAKTMIKLALSVAAC